MKIYNAKLVGISHNDQKDVSYLHFAYKSKYVEGCGVITCSLFPNQEIKGTGSLKINERYDIYIVSRNGYNNIKGMYEHKDKNTDRITVDIS